MLCKSIRAGYSLISNSATLLNNRWSSSSPPANPTLLTPSWEIFTTLLYSLGQVHQNQGLQISPLRVHVGASSRSRQDLRG
jgi:hypothetical protein